MSIVAKCISDQTKNNYSGLVIDTSHSLVTGINGIGGEGGLGYNVGFTRPYRITTDQNGNPSVEAIDTRIGNPIYPTIYSSTKTKIFKKICDDGFQSIGIPYSVTVNSLVSQQDADIRALAKLDVEGIAYAQVYGTCQCTLTWVEPTITYLEASAKVRIVIPNATEYRVDNGQWLVTNEFIITQDGEYNFAARKGTGCVVDKVISIRINPENDIYGIKLTGFNCEANTEDDAIINNIKLVLNSCDDISDRDVFNIKFIEEGCSLEGTAEISDIKLVKAC